MLCYDPAQRITARQALAHPWFDSVRSAEEARGQAALAAARQLRQQMQLRPRPPTGPGQAAAATTAGVASPSVASGSGGSAGPPTTPAATRGHLLSWEGRFCCVGALRSDMHSALATHGSRPNCCLPGPLQVWCRPAGCHRNCSGYCT